MEEDDDAVELVVVDHTADHGRAHGRRRQQRDQQDVLRLRPGDQQHAHHHGDQHRRRAEVGLDDDQRRRHADEHQPLDEPGVVQGVGAILGEERGEGEQGGELGELGGLHLQRAEVEAQPGSPADRPDQDHQHQEHDRHAVEEPGPLAPPVVVERHDHDHRDHGTDQEDLLAGDVQVRVGELGVRRGVDREQPDDRQRTLGEQQAPSRCCGSASRGWP